MKQKKPSTIALLDPTSKEIHKKWSTKLAAHAYTVHLGKNMIFSGHKGEISTGQNLPGT